MINNNKIGDLLTFIEKELEQAKRRVEELEEIKESLFDDETKNKIAKLKKLSTELK
jgi:hypothetical protein|tara:strand:- start:2015 stop:2182 length:168 start_codon:yes stop_codon:yes gene_type:complete